MPIVRVNILFDSTPRTIAIDLPSEHMGTDMVERMQKDFEDAVAFELAKMAQAAAMTKEVHERALAEAEDDSYELGTDSSDTDSDEVSSLSSDVDQSASRVKSKRVFFKTDDDPRVQSKRVFFKADDSTDVIPSRSRRRVV